MLNIIVNSGYSFISLRKSLVKKFLEKQKVNLFIPNNINNVQKEFSSKKLNIQKINLADQKKNFFILLKNSYSLFKRISNKDRKNVYLIFGTYMNLIFGILSFFVFSKKNIYVFTGLGSFFNSNNKLLIFIIRKFLNFLFINKKTIFVFYNYADRNFIVNKKYYNKTVIIPGSGIKINKNKNKNYKNIKKKIKFNNSDKNIFLKNRVTRENDLVPSHLYDLDYPINGVYIYKSNDGLLWNKIVNSPVMHRVFSSDTIKMGEIDFDTNPSIIKFKDEYIYYGRLNTSRQERRIYLRKSKDLLSWDDPVKINITNETPHNNILKNNYYHIIPFIYKNKLYALVPFFKAILLETHNEYKDSRTLIMESSDGINWFIKGNILRFPTKYKSRVNDVKVINNKILIYTRDNITLPNPIYFKYNLDI